MAVYISPFKQLQSLSITTTTHVEWPLSKDTVKKYAFFRRTEVSDRRRELLKDLNGNAFFSLKLWPKEIQAVFWKKPMGDTETFKLALFFIGNGCAPILFTEWILLAQYWAESAQKTETRARQIDFVVNNADSQNSKWFYFDYNMLHHLNGKPKQ